MTSLYEPITLIREFYYMSNGLTFEILDIIQGNQFRIDGEIDEKRALQIIVS